MLKKEVVRRLFLVVLTLLALVSVIISCEPTQAPAPTPSPAPTSSPTPTPTTTPSPQPAPVQTPVSKELKIHFIDVGQGDAILIDLDDVEVLIDGGDRSPGVVNYLKKYVDGPLEVMIATHPHADHIGGLIDVLASFEVKEIWYNGETTTSKTYSDFISAVNAENAQVNIATRGNIIKADSLSFKVLNPFNLNGTNNNNSIVLHLAYGQIDFLFEGDAEKEAEGVMLVKSDMPVPDVEVLKVGHHGSRTASSQNFLAVTTPEVAIYMAGKGNTYGHPHAETIEALSAIGAEIYGTDVHGNIVVSTDGEKYELQLEKQAPPVMTTSTPTPTPSEKLPASTVELPSVIGEETSSTELIPVNYSWTYNGKWSWEGKIPLSLYEYYRKLPRPPTKNYSVYVTHPLDDPYIDRLVEKIKNAAQQEGYTAYQTVEFAAAFVQSLPYTVDSVTTPYDEYPRYPIETLVDKGGDCEDTSILLASIIDKIGYGVVLIILPNHCCIRHNKRGPL
jgi:competence protein ComEC